LPLRQDNYYLTVAGVGIYNLRCRLASIVMVREAPRKKRNFIRLWCSMPNCDRRSYLFGMPGLISTNHPSMPAEQVDRINNLDQPSPITDWLTGLLTEDRHVAKPRLRGRLDPNIKLSQG
jgi:hypothetical protein